MPAFTLYGAHGSTATNRVLLTLAEGGFKDYDFVPLNLPKGEQKSTEHKQRHPWGKVPVMVAANGFTLFESRAICKYLAMKYSFPLLPSARDIEATALFEQAQSIEVSYFADPASRIEFERTVKKFMNLPTDEAVVCSALKSLEAYLDIANDMLHKQAYMAGDQFSLVDIWYIPLVRRLFDGGFGGVIVGRQHVNAWWNRCSTRSAVEKVYVDHGKAE